MRMRLHGIKIYPHKYSQFLINPSAIGVKLNFDFWSSQQDNTTDSTLQILQNPGTVAPAKPLQTNYERLVSYLGADAITAVRLTNF